MSQQRYLDIYFACPPELHEMLGAELFESGFEGIWEQENELHAYIPVSDYRQEMLYDIFQHYGLDTSTIELVNLDDVNWNEDWERSYEPIDVSGQCRIRAEFHQKLEGAAYDIII